MLGKVEPCTHDEDMTDPYGTKTDGAERVLWFIVVTRVGRGRHIGGRAIVALSPAKVITLATMGNPLLRRKPTVFGPSSSRIQIGFVSLSSILSFSI